MPTSDMTSDLARLSEHSAFRDPIVKRPITQVIGEKIAGLIGSGVLQVGDALPGERDLSAALHVSRAAVRGGVQWLAAQGILEISHGARTRVKRSDVGQVTVGFARTRAIDAYDLESVHASRLLVEREVVADAARHMTDEAIRLLDDLLEAQREMLDDPVRFLICDHEFHVAIYRGCSNRLLADFSADLHAYMMEARRAAMARPGAIATSHADHRDIVEALRARDPERAAGALARHTTRIYATTQSVMQGEPPAKS